MSQSGKLPDFLIIGAMRTATTTLWTYLKDHPQIYMAKKKEIGYFCDRKFQDYDLDWYTDLFSEADDSQLCGEASTRYSRWPHYGNVAERIHNTCPNIKLIYVLRNPIDRTHSHYAHKMQTAKRQITFAQALQEDSEYIDTSLYYEQIKQFLNYFSHDSLLCVLYDDLTTDTENTLVEIQRFLELDIVQLSKNTTYSLNSRGEMLVKRKLEDNLRKIPGFRNLKRLLPTAVKQKAFKAIKNTFYGEIALKEYRPETMTDEMRNHLMKVFEKPNQELSQFLRRDLSHWV